MIGSIQFQTVKPDAFPRSMIESGKVQMDGKTIELSPAIRDGILQMSRELDLNEMQV